MTDPRTPQLTIAELAERAGVTPRTIRYYVAEGLLPLPGGNGQRRVYGPEHLARLEAIRNLKASYLPLHEIRRKLVAAHPYVDASALVSALATRRADATPPRSTSAKDLPATPVGPAARATGPTAHLPFGLGRQPQLGRVEIYEPTESVWHRYTLAPGVELHYRDTTDPTLKAAIERIIAAAAAILDERAEPPRARPEDAQSSGQRD